MRKELARNGPAVSRAQRVQDASLDRLEPRKAAAALTGCVNHTAEVAGLVSNERHSVVVQIGDQNLRRCVGMLIARLDDQVLRVNVQTVPAPAFRANRHELARPVRIEERRRQRLLDPHSCRFVERFGCGDRAPDAGNRPFRPQKVIGERLQARDVADDEHRPERQCSRVDILPERIALGERIDNQLTLEELVRSRLRRLPHRHGSDRRAPQVERPLAEVPA